MNVLPIEKQIQIVNALVEGNSIRSTARMVGVEHKTNRFTSRGISRNVSPRQRGAESRPDASGFLAIEGAPFLKQKNYQIGYLIFVVPFEPLMSRLLQEFFPALVFPLRLSYGEFA